MQANAKKSPLPTMRSAGGERITDIRGPTEPFRFLGGYLRLDGSPLGAITGVSHMGFSGIDGGHPFNGDHVSQ